MAMRYSGNIVFLFGCWCFFACDGQICDPIAGDTCSTSNVTVGDVTDVTHVPSGTATLWFVRPFWPVTPNKLPLYISIVVCVWLFIGFSVRSTRTQQDEIFEERRATQVMDQVAQVVYEHWKVEIELHAYEKRESQLQELARQRIWDAKGSIVGDIRASPEYQEIIIETGFVDVYGPDKPVPVRLSPKRFLDALMDEIDQCPVSKVDAVLRKLQSDELCMFALLFREAHLIMLLRMTAKLDDTVSKTKDALDKHAGNAAYSAYTTGSKLLEVLDTAKDIHKCFYARRFFSLLPAADIDSFGHVDELAPFKERRLKREDALGPLQSRAELEAAFIDKLKVARALQQEIDKAKGHILKKLLAYCEPMTLVHIGLVILTRFVYAVVGPLHQSIIAGIVESASSESWQFDAFNGCVAWMAIFCMDWWVCDFINIVCTAKATETITIKLRNELFQAIMRQDTVFFETHETGWIQDRLKRDCDEFSHKILLFPVHLLSDLLQIITKSLFLYYYCPRMTYNALGMGFIGAVPMVVMQRYVQQLVRKSDRFVARTNARTDEILKNLSTVREFARERQESTNFAHAEKSKAETSLYIHAMRHVQWPIILTILAFGYLMNVYEGAGRIHYGQMRPSDVVMVVGETWCVIWHCRCIVEKLHQFMELMLPAERVFRLLEQRSAVEPMPGDNRVPFETCRGDGSYEGGVEVEFEGVFFAYPTMAEHRVLRNLTLKIPAGKTVSLVGERGCGKTSTLELIQRKYDLEPGEGVIRVNGRPIQEWDLRQYRRRLAVVAQGPTIFANTIKENILYGLSDQERLDMGFDGPMAATVGHQELKRICELACCWDFIKDFPLQFETRIGCGGIKLSGGQTQCLTIARALIKKPAFLILDEATAALDNETQKKVSENISSLQKEFGFTIVQIAHRLTTLTDSDIIYFLNHGTVVESGGSETQNGSAVEELNNIEIERHSVRNPETGEQDQHIAQGFFHHYWNVANDIKSFHELSSAKLAAKVRELRCDLDKATVELSKKHDKNVAKLLPALLLARSVSDPTRDRTASRRLSELAQKDGALAQIALPGSDEMKQKLKGFCLDTFAFAPEPLKLERAIT